MTDINEWMDEHSHTLDELKQVNEFQVYEAVSEASYDVGREDFLEDQIRPDFEIALKKGRELYETCLQEGEIYEGETFDDFYLKEYGYEPNFKAYVEFKQDEIDDQWADLGHDLTDAWYPMWNTLWEFPSWMSASDLNALRISALTFLDVEYVKKENDPDPDWAWEWAEQRLNEDKEEARKDWDADTEFEAFFEDYMGYSPTIDDAQEHYEEEIRTDWKDGDYPTLYGCRETGTLVGLSGCGMDLSPALLYAYYAYSYVPDYTNPDANTQAILDKIVNTGASYFTHVIGIENYLDLAEKIGEEALQKADKECQERYAEFDKTLADLTEARDKGDVDQVTTGLLALSALNKTQAPYNP